MNKALKLKITALVLFAVIALAAIGLVLGIVFADDVAFAAEDNTTTEIPAVDAEEEPTVTEPADNGDDSKGTIALAAAIAVGIAAGAGAIGMGIAVAKSNESIARQPEAKGDIRSSMMLGLVFIETAIIYALIVAILVIFVL